jgi:hypothetical protein
MWTEHTSEAVRGRRPDGRRERVGLAAGVTTLVVLVVAFGAMALGVPYFWIAFPVGFGGVLPVVVALAGRRGRSSDRSAAGVDVTPADTPGGPDQRDDALRTLRDRYARGELDDAAFERRLERLLETETVEDATDWTRSRTSAGQSEGDDPGE